MVSPPAAFPDDTELSTRNVQPENQAKQLAASVREESSMPIKNDSELSNTDASQRNVASHASVPHQSRKQATTISAPHTGPPSSKVTAQESVAIKDNAKSTRTNFFLDGLEDGIHDGGPPHRNSMGSYHVSHTPNDLTTASTAGRSRDVWQPTLPIRHPGHPLLISQPLISTPALPMTSLLYNESFGDIRHLFTPTPVGPFQAYALPTQSSDHTNLSCSNGAVFEYPSRSRERMNCFNFAFSPSPMMQIPSTVARRNSTADRAAASGSAQLPKRITTHLQPIVSKKSIETIANINKRQAKKKAKNSRVANPVKRPARKSVDVFSALSLDVTTRPCSCPKSRCIKLYCECFQRGLLCDPALCVCTRCQNTDAQAGPQGARTMSAKSILSRRPAAFILRPKKTGEGCSCKKSR